MRLILQVALCGALLMGGAMAQHRGGGGGGGMSRGGGSMGGGSIGGSHGFIGGGSVGGGIRGSVGSSFGGSYSSAGRVGGIGGIGGSFRGGTGVGVLNRGGGVIRGGYGYRGYPYGFRGYYGYGYPYLGFGFGYGYAGYWPGYYGGYYDYGYPYDYSYSAGYGYPAYQSSPNVTVIYPPNPAPSYDGPNQGARNYDQYGQEIRPPANAGGNSQAQAPASTTTYLLAFKDGTIHQAASYWISGNTLHYVTLQHEEKQAAADSLDRDQTLQLNRERRVPFIWPSTQTPR